MTKLQETKDETIKQLYNTAYTWYLWGVQNDYMEVMFKEALDYISADAFDRWQFDVAFDAFKYIVNGFWQEEEQLFVVDINKLDSAYNYYNIMTTSVNKIINDKDFITYFYVKHQDIAKAMISYKEITND